MIKIDAEEIMVFSKRCKLAKEVDLIFDEADKDGGSKIKRDSLGVITVLMQMGFLNIKKK